MMAIQVFLSGVSFKKKKLIIAESIGAKATIISVFAAVVFSIEYIKTIFKKLNHTTEIDQMGPIKIFKKLIILDSQKRVKKVIHFLKNLKK